jgi:hypothetical protein
MVVDQFVLTLLLKILSENQEAGGRIRAAMRATK